MTMRLGKAVPLVALAALLFANVSAFADPFEQLDLAVEICTSLPQTRAVVVERLRESGWVSDSKAVGAVLWSGIFAFNLKPDDVAYSLDNANMWANSIGRNDVSGDDKDRQGFIGRYARLAIIAGERANGYCVLTGDVSLMEYLKSKVTFSDPTSDQFNTRFRGDISDQTVEIVVLNRSELQPLIAEAKPKYLDPANFVYDDVNVFISPAKQEEQE
jgi:hypothetical protein